MTYERFAGAAVHHSLLSMLYALVLYRGVFSSEEEHHRFRGGGRGIAGPQGVNNLMPGWCERLAAILTR